MSTFTDNNGTPIYLEIPDLILSGKVTKNNETKEFNLRKEISSVTLFAKSLVIAISESKEDVIKAYFNKEITSEELIKEAYSLTSDPAFRANLVKAIEEIPDDNFSMSLLMNVSDSLINFIDLSTIDSTGLISEPINIMFKNDYISNVIEEEKLIKEYNNEAETPIKFEHIKATDIINKNDLLSLINLAFTVGPTLLDESFDASDISGSILPLLNNSLDSIKSLTIFKENKKMNVCIGRLYKFSEVAFLSGNNESNNSNNTSNEPSTNVVRKTISNSSTSITASDLEIIKNYVDEINNDFDWFYETSSLFDCVKEIGSLYSAYTSIESDDILNKILGTLSDEDSKEAINKLFNYLEKSKLIGETLGSKFITSTLESALKSFLGDNYTLPTNMSFNNTYDKDGVLIERGELSNIFGIINILLSDENKDLFNSIMGLISGGTQEETNNETTVSLNKSTIDNEEIQEESDTSIVTIIESFINVLDKKYNNKSFKDYLLDSNLFRSVLSALIVNKAQSIIFVPNSAKETFNGLYTANIKKDELNTLLNALPKTEDDLTLVLGLISGAGDQSALFGLFGTELFDNLLKSKIIQSTIGSFIIKMKLPILVMPKELEDPNNWATNGDDESEIIKLLNALEILDLDISSLFGGSSDQVEQDSQEESNPILSVVASLFNLTKNEAKFNELFESEIIHYTISNFLDNNIDTLIPNNVPFKVIIPSSSTIYLDEDDSIERLITVDQLNKLLGGLSKLGITSFDDIGSIFSDTEQLITTLAIEKDEILKSNILSASLVYVINGLTTGDNSVLSVPTNLSSKANEDELKEYSSLNPWNTELNNLLSNLYVIFDLDNKENKISFAGTIKSKLEKMLSDDFDLLTSSQIIMHTLTSTIDNYLTKDYISEKALKKAKINGSYDKDELRSVLELLKVNGASLNNISEFMDELSTDGFKFIDIDKKVVDSKDEKESDMYFNNPNLNFYLIRGLITKQILNIDDINPHPYAFDDNASYLLKKTEIVSILNLFRNDQGKIEIDFDKLTNLTVKDVLKTIGSSTCNSYLVVGIISDTLMQNSDSLTIPSTCLDIFNNISFVEIKNLLNSIKILSNGDDSTSIQNLDFTIGTDVKISAELMKSQIINAAVTKQLKTLSVFGGNDVGIEKKCAIVTKDQNNETIILLSTTEVNALVSIMEMDNIDLSIFTSNSDDEKNTKDKGTLLSSSIMRVMISEKYNTDEVKAYLNSPYNTEINTDTSMVYYLGDKITTKELKIFTNDEITKLIKGLNNIQSAS